MLNLPLRRYAFVGGCLVGIVVILLAIDFSDRGPRFGARQADAKTDRAGTYDLGQARIIARVIGHVRSHYVDPERVDAKAMAAAAMLRVQATVPEILVEIARDRRDVATNLVVTVDHKKKHFGLQRVDNLYQLNWKLMHIFEFLEAHLPPLVDLESLEFAAANGLLSTLDPHSVLLPPRVYREMQLDTKGRFGGLGIVVSIRSGLLTVMSVMRGTPAAEAKLEPGDQIVQIGAESTVNMSLNEAVNLLRGEPASDVTIWVKREGWDVARPVAMTRREIRVPSVQYEGLGDGIGYINIRSFQDNTADNLHEALNHFQKQKGGLKGVVLDLRNNPGGLLDKAIAVSDAFLPHGTIVTTIREGAREREESHATSANTLTELPLVVLTNRGSASASEIVAGALKRNDRAIVLGSTSFGKGSVQVVYRIDEAALKLTVAQYLTPGDVSIQSVGIVPDIEILTLTVDADGMDLYPSAHVARGEADLDSHLNSKRTIDSRPSVQLRIAESVEESADAGNRRQGGDDFEPDALTLMAKELLGAAPAPNRKQALVQAAGFLSQRQIREETRLAEALAKLGIDWQPGQNPAQAKLESSLTIARADAAGGKGGGTMLQAGEGVTVTATLKNVGRRGLYRVHGLLASEIGALDGKEVVFGYLAPGASVRRTVNARIPESQADTGDKVSMKLFVDEAPLKSTGDALVEVKALPRPLFAHSVQVADPTGNGDGLIQRGERIELLVRVTNVGAGKAHKVLATIKNESGQDVFIKRGRADLGQLEVGQEATARFELEVRRTLKARSLQLKLSILDQTLKSWASDDLSVRVFPEGFPPRRQMRGVATLGQAATAVRAGAHRDAPEVAEVGGNAVVALVGSAGDWLEIAWPHPADGQRRGWIPANRASVGDSGGPTRDAVAETLQHQPPVLDLSPPPRVTTARKLHLVGKARFAGSGQKRRHMYVFRGKDKVYFQSARSADTLRDELEFDVAIPLEPGSNDFTVVVRQEEDDMTQHHFTVFRR